MNALVAGDGRSARTSSTPRTTSPAATAASASMRPRITSRSASISRVSGLPAMPVIVPRHSANAKRHGLCQADDVSTCVTCDLIARRDRGEAPLWDSIRRTPGWDVVHAFGTTVEGWVVLVARRHITAVADMSDEEAETLGPLFVKCHGRCRWSSTARRPTSSSSPSTQIIHTYMCT